MDAEIKLESFNFSLRKGKLEKNDYKQKRYFNKAAFELHQATENLLQCVELVFEGYKPPSHNLFELKKRNQKFIPQLQNFFFDEHKKCTCGKKIVPSIYKSQKGLEKICVNCNKEARAFLLIATAYVDARYSDDYKILKEELKEINQKVLKLEILVKKRCEDEIANLRILKQ